MAHRAYQSDTYRPKQPKRGAIGLVNEGDMIEIDIQIAVINLNISADELAKRRAEMEACGNQAWKPVNRERHVSVSVGCCLCGNGNISR